MEILSSKEVVEEITNYLSAGGLFNPELMNPHDATDLLISARDIIVKLQKEEKRQSVITPVFMLCDAYESGFGQGLHASDGIQNPYHNVSTPELYEAWNIGYKLAKERTKSK